MMLGFNAQCENLKDKLVETINESRLPITVTYYILQEILTVAERQKAESVDKERREFIKENENDNTDV